MTDTFFTGTNPPTDLGQNHNDIRRKTSVKIIDWSAIDGTTMAKAKHDVPYNIPINTNTVITDRKYR